MDDYEHELVNLCELNSEPALVEKNGMHNTADPLLFFAHDRRF